MMTEIITINLLSKKLISCSGGVKVCLIEFLNIAQTYRSLITVAGIKYVLHHSTACLLAAISIHDMI